MPVWKQKQTLILKTISDVIRFAALYYRHSRLLCPWPLLHWETNILGEQLLIRFEVVSVGRGGPNSWKKFSSNWCFFAMVKLEDAYLLQRNPVCVHGNDSLVLSEEEDLQFLEGPAIIAVLHVLLQWRRLGHFPTVCLPFFDVFLKTFHMEYYVKYHVATCSPSLLLISRLRLNARGRNPLGKWSPARGLFPAIAAFSSWLRELSRSILGPSHTKRRRIWLPLLATASKTILKCFAWYDPLCWICPSFDLITWARSVLIYRQVLAVYIIASGDILPGGVSRQEPRNLRAAPPLFTAAETELWGQVSPGEGERPLSDVPLER